MKNIKKTILITLIIGLLFNLTGCTNAVWSYNKDTSYRYNDTLIALYSTPNGDEVYFIGKQYHYVFKTDGKKLQPLIQLRSVEGLVFDLKNGDYHIKLNHPDKIQATFTAIIDKNIASSELISWAREHGFSEQEKTLVHTYSLNGIRYMKSQKVNTHVQKLSNPIHITVLEHQQGFNSVYKLALTPLAIAGDTIIIATLPVILFSLAYMLKDYHG